MLLTLLDIIIEVNFVIPEHREAGITSTLLPKVKDSTWLPKFQLLQYLAFQTTEVNPVQPEKAPFSISVTLSDIVTDVKPLQP